mgnify:CR=1 FL=1
MILNFKKLKNLVIIEFITFTVLNVIFLLVRLLKQTIQRSYALN